MFFTFPRKKLYLIVFSRGISAKQHAKRGRCKLQEPIERRNFGAKLTYICGFWLDVSFFSQLKKRSFAIMIGRFIFFFTCEKYHIHLWLLIGRIVFLTIEKKIFRNYDWTFLFFFFSRVKNIVRSSDWLELICVWRVFISFQWVYLSIYIHCTGGTWHCIIINNYCIPRARMGSEWIAHEGERNNCFSKIQLVGKKYRDKTT